MAALAVALAFGRPPLVALLGLALTNGVLSALFRAAESAAVRQVVADADRPTAIAYTQAYQQAAIVGGPPLGGLLYAVGQSLPFLTDAISYLVSYSAITAIHLPLQDPHESQQPRHSMQDRLLEGLRWIFAVPFLRASVVYITAFTFIASALVLTVMVRANAHGANPAEIGMMFALAGIGGIAGALTTPWIQRRWPPGAVLLVLGAVWTVVIPLLTMTTHPFLLGGILLVLGFTIPPSNTLVVSFMMGVTPDRLQSQAYASTTLVTNSCAPLGSLAAGFLLTAIGSTGSLLVLTVVTITVVAASASALNAESRTSV
jgi:predicted MFS family arabinose efflux permease